MIGERHLAGGRAATAGAQRRTRSERPAVRARAARAGRERLLTAIEGSVLTQLVVVMGLVAAAALLYLSQASQASVIQLDILALQQEQSQLAIHNAALHATAAGLQSPQRIAQVAASRLHMGTPPGDTTIWIAPVLPRVAPVPPLGADGEQARTQSQPLAWMRHAVEVVEASL